MSVLAAASELDSEVAAWGFYESARWPNGVSCPFCGCERAYFITPKNGTGRSTRTGAESVRRVWKCAACRRQFSALTGTLLEGTKVPLLTWMRYLADVLAGDLMPLRSMAEHYGVSLGTARQMRDRINPSCDEVAG